RRPSDLEEQKRHITIHMALAAFTHEGVKINLIDTPGYADFAADQRAGMRIADAAIVFVDASAGIQVGTQIAWNELEARRTPRVFLIGRLDRENADFDEVLGQLRETYGIRVVPVLASSAHRHVGYAALLNAIREMLPSPAEAGSLIGKSPSGDEIARKPDLGEKLSAFVFKTIADPFVGKLSYVRVYSGTLHSNTSIYDATKTEAERVGQIFFLRGKEQEPTNEVGAGDVCAIPKLTATTTNATLCEKDAVILYDAIDFPAPPFSVAVDPANKAHLDKLRTPPSHL